MAQQQDAPDRRIVPLSGLRGIIARAMSRAWQAPQVTLGLEFEVGPLLARVRQLGGQGGKVTPTALVLTALARTLPKHPRMNALLTEQGIEEVRDVHLAVAVDTANGLLTPVIRDAHDKGALEIAAELSILAVQARAGKLPPAAYQRGTFTFSNLGGAGIDWVTPVLNPPQVGILGMGRCREAVVVRDGTPVAAQVSTLTLVFDHRAIDGMPASLFLRDLAACLTAADF
ncbi:2-oxo acid dehydrogenase subunit E2 [Pseudomonas sp. BN415]|nr:2-oxo acid dehydrogenase subunit E2 [Pseudomonas sp. BN415]